MENPQGRHEYKHMISYFDYLLLRQRISAIAKPDPHARPDGVYFIRSLYFDNYTDQALREKLNGVDEREKFRIRLYNQNKSFIRLEKKAKRRGICFKESAPLTESQCRMILDGDYDFLQSSAFPLCRELYHKLQIELFRPKTVVDYLREPYIFAPGNVRITFDSDIRTGGHRVDFLEDSLITYRATGTPMLLEVKFDRFLPQMIQDALSLPNCTATAFSKYAICRMAAL